ncbi:MAG: L-serine ammonia-lyase, iron-sulfur-dependent, subunit alpha [Termitinemataceae bacterium]
MNYQFSTIQELQDILESEGLEFDGYLIQREAFITNKSQDQVLCELDRRISVTRAALIRGLSEPQISRSGLTQGAAFACFENRTWLVRDPFFQRVIAYALAINEVNACGGKIVAFPTAGSSGIVPGVLWAWWDTFAEPKSPSSPESDSLVFPFLPGPLEPPYERRLRGAFLMASLIGIVIAQGASLAGAEGGCQAECGSAGAMAAAAVAYLNGASLMACCNAAALSLKNSLGLACDPVAGLVEVPCVKRNAFVAVNAITAAQLTLAGIQSSIPFDEVLWAMKQIGDSLPASIKESAEGGLASTPTGLRYKRIIMEGGAV